jgi:glutaminase
VRAETELGAPVNVVVNCAGIAVAQRVLSKKGPHALQSFLKVGREITFHDTLVFIGRWSGARNAHGKTAASGRCCR